MSRQLESRLIDTNGVGTTWIKQGEDPAQLSENLKRVHLILTEEYTSVETVKVIRKDGVEIEWRLAPEKEKSIRELHLELKEKIQELERKITELEIRLRNSSTMRRYY